MSPADDALPEELGNLSLQQKAPAPSAQQQQDSGAADVSSKAAYSENRVDMAIKQALEDVKERATVLNIEEQVERFILDTKQLQLEFPGSFTNYQRMLAHRIAQHYGLQTSTVDYEEGPGRVIARRTPWCRLPKVKLRDLPVNATRPAVGIPKVLIRRVPADSAAVRAGPSASPQQQSPTPPPSDKERLEEYNAARDRLIGKSLEAAATRNFGTGRSSRGGGGGNSNNFAGGAGASGSGGGRGGQQQYSGTSGSAGGSAGQPGPRSPAAPRGGRKAVFRDRDKELQDPEYRRGGGKLGPSKSPHLSPKHLSPKNSQGDLHSTPPLSPQQQRGDKQAQLNHTAGGASQQQPQLKGAQQQGGSRPQLVGGLKGSQQQQDALEPRDTMRQRDAAGDDVPPRLLTANSRGERERRGDGSRPSTSTSHNPPPKTPSPLPPNSPAHSNASSTTWHPSGRGSSNSVRAPPPPPHTPPKVYPTSYAQPTAYHMPGTHPYPAYTMGPYPMTPAMGVPYHPAMGPSPGMAPGMPGHPPFMPAQYPGYPFPPQYAMLPPGAESMAMATSPYQYYPPPYGQMAFSPQFPTQPTPMGPPMMAGPGGMAPPLMGPPASSKPSSSRSNHSGAGGGAPNSNNAGSGGANSGASPRE